MRTLITPSEVAAIAFGHSEALSPETITRAAILAAQRRFIKPVLGTLYTEMLDGQHADLLAEYIKTPLALYVKWITLPVLSVQSGNLGSVQIRSSNFIPADARSLARARRRIKADANTLMLCAVEHIRENPAAYPAFDGGLASKMCGGVIL